MASYKKSSSFFISYLAQSLAKGGSETTIYLSTITTLTGEVLATADFEDLDFGEITIDPLTTTGIESCTFTGIDAAALSLTGCTRGLSAKGDDVSALRKQYHPIGTLVILTFGVQTLNNLYNKGLGDVLGPSSSTDNAIARFDSTTGKLLQNSALTISDIAGGVTELRPAGKSGDGTIIQIYGGASTDGQGAGAYLIGANSIGALTGGIGAVYGGQGGATGAGGSAIVQGGAGGATSGNGGEAQLLGGNATAGNSNGGDVFLQGGNKSGSGTLGKVKIGTYGSVAAILDGTSLASSDKTFTFPNKSGTFAMTSDITAGSSAVYTASGTTLSLTTTAGQVVIVWAKGWRSDSPGDVHTYLNYNGVQKDVVQLDPATAGNKMPFSLMYTETPGAGTHDITVTGGTLNNVVIIAQVIG